MFNDNNGDVIHTLHKQTIHRKCQGSLGGHSLSPASSEQPHGDPHSVSICPSMCSIPNTLCTVTSESKDTSSHQHAQMAVCWMLLNLELIGL